MQTASHTLTLRPHPLGDEWGTVMSSTDPWYRYLRAVAELFLAGEIDVSRMQMMEVGHARDADCPAARQLRNFLSLTWMEPKCAHDFYKGCDCPELTDDDRRARLRELMGE